MWQNPLNNPRFSSLSLRNKLILAALIGFLFGVMLRGGGGAVGRYQFNSSDPTFVIDTQTGDAFKYSAESRSFVRFGSIPWH